MLIIVGASIEIGTLVLFLSPFTFRTIYFTYLKLVVCLFNLSVLVLG